MKKQRTRRQKAIIRRRIFLSFCSVILICAVALTAFIIKSAVSTGEKPKAEVNKNSSVASQPKEPEFKETTATVISTGDIMVHSTQLEGAYVKSTGDYDFSAFFKETAPYFKKADLAVANLEVTFGGAEYGKFSGYPAFNTPDSLADTIKDSGINLLLTANNHSYDTKLAGLKRTAQVLKQKGIDFIGTKETAYDPTYTVKQINDINIGITNFTYESSPSNALAGRKYLNGTIIAQEANGLINTFSYTNTTKFYSEAENIISSMKNDGADFIVFYMHWGNEYKTNANTHQKTIAQQLSNLGVDMIIGSHPHVIQPVELIYSENGQTNTVCLYSTGNAVSNQRQELMDSCPSGHTEDGMLFSFTLRKTKNGVILDSLDLIPTWVNKYTGGGGYQYTIYPIESPDKAAEKYSFDSATAARMTKSYNRTMAIVSEGLKTCKENLLGIAN